jgi:mRNA interferase MazF
MKTAVSIPNELFRRAEAKAKKLRVSRSREAPGNVLAPRRASRLPKDSVVNVSQLFTLDRAFLTGQVGTLPARWLALVESGLRLVLEL